MRRIALVAVALGALLVPGGADAGDVTRVDAAGRVIHFDVQAEDVGVDWYAGLLRTAAHGSEIERVTIRIVPLGEIGAHCGTPEAGACYTGFGRRPLIVVPAGRGPAVARAVLHEYGHHVDRSHRHGGLPEPNGTRRWWLARGIDRLIELESVARDYRLGWERSIGEIYAEDYAYAQLGTQHKIGWLEPPDAVVRRALLADLGLGTSNVTAPAKPAVKPVLIRRSGVLAPGERLDLDFGLLGPRRRVTFTAQVMDGSNARIELTCSDGRQVAKRLTGTSATIDVASLGPAECRATVRSTGTAPQRYGVRLRLSVNA